MDQHVYFRKRFISELSKVKIGDMVACYLYGSRVYESNAPNADYDYILVIKDRGGFRDEVRGHDVDFTIYDETTFQQKIDAHELSVLECIFLPEHKVVFEDRKFTFNLNLSRLRHAISEKCSVSFVKCKKKIAEGEAYIGKKSLWHSLRMAMFGIQLAATGTIFDYSEANALLPRIMDLPDDWSILKATFQEHHNYLMSNFRARAPKE